MEDLLIKKNLHWTGHQLTACRDIFYTLSYHTDKDYVAAHVSATKTQSIEIKRKGILIPTCGHLWHYGVLGMKTVVVGLLLI